eukprot:630226-Amphidinium_carterae.1
MQNSFKFTEIENECVLKEQPQRHNTSHQRPWMARRSYVSVMYIKEYKALATRTSMDSFPRL